MSATVVEATPDIARARIKLAVDYPGFTNVRLWRFVDAQPPVRLRNVRTADGTVLPPTYDYEAPLERSLGYAAVAWNDPDPEPEAPLVAEVTTGLDVGDTAVWLKDVAEPSLNRELNCVAVLPQRQFAANLGLFRVLGSSYPVAVHDVMSSWTGTIVWLEPDIVRYDSMERTIARGTPLLLQTGLKYGAINEYIQPQTFTSQHMQNANLTERYASLQFATVAAPVGDQLLQSDYTFQDMYDDWADFSEVLGAYLNFYGLLRGETQ